MSELSEGALCTSSTILPHDQTIACLPSPAFIHAAPVTHSSGPSSLSLTVVAPLPCHSQKWPLPLFPGTHNGPSSPGNISGGAALAAAAGWATMQAPPESRNRHEAITLARSTGV